jgi:hypothetical protein
MNATIHINPHSIEMYITSQTSACERRESFLSRIYTEIPLPRSPLRDADARHSELSRDCHMPTQPILQGQANSADGQCPCLCPCLCPLHRPCLRPSNASPESVGNPTMTTASHSYEAPRRRKWRLKYIVIRRRETINCKRGNTRKGKSTPGSCP